MATAAARLGDQMVGILGIVAEVELHPARGR
jgi:hypothetical protein